MLEIEGTGLAWFGGGALMTFFVVKLVQHFLTLRADSNFGASKGCKPLKVLPNTWLKPFGLDKLGKVQEAERLGRFPPLMAAEHDLHGNTYAQWSGVNYIVVTREPENIKAALFSNFKDFSLGSFRNANFHSLLGDGIFTQDGPQWSKSRNLLRPFFNQKDVPDLEFLEVHIRNLIDILKVPAKESTAVDLHELFLHLTFDSSTGFIFGKPIYTLLDEYRHESERSRMTFSGAFNSASQWLARRERLLHAYWLIGGRDFKNVCNVVRENVEGMIAKSLLPDREEVLKTRERSILKSVMDEEADQRTVRDQLLNILFAARDTSAAFLGWIFYMLAREPQIYAKLREEVLGIVGAARPPTREELQQLTYLDSVLTEVLRLFPIVPLNAREAIRTTTAPVGGGNDGKSPILIPKGTIVAYSVYAMQRSKEIYGDDANEFRPERWNNGSLMARVKSQWAYLPFNGGPRVCLGQRLALAQAAYITCRLVQTFETISLSKVQGTGGPSRSNVTTSDGWREEDTTYSIALSMAPGDGVKVHLKLAD